VQATCDVLRGPAVRPALHERGELVAALVQCGPDGRAAQDVAHRLHVSLTRPYLLLGSRFVVGASIGVAFWRPGVTAAELMREADLAMYEAKAGGKGRVVVYRPLAATMPTARTVDGGPLADGAAFTNNSSHTSFPDGDPLADSAHETAR